MSGGYAPQIEDIVDIHFQTIRIAAERHKELVYANHRPSP
jgi:hypothetical protein